MNELMYSRFPFLVVLRAAHAPTRFQALCDALDPTLSVVGGTDELDVTQLAPADWQARHRPLPHALGGLKSTNTNSTAVTALNRTHLTYP